MKYSILLILSMGLFSSLFSCNSNRTNKSKTSESPKVERLSQDRTNKIVRQMIFDELAIFSYRDFENLESNKSYDKFKIGDLHISSGKVVCADPMHRGFGFPQEWEVPVGNYPVNIYIGISDDFKGRVAYSEITFSNEDVESWELSLIEETFFTDEIDKKINGMYPVENGLSSFSDYETWKEYDKRVTLHQNRDSESNFYNDILAPQFKLNDGIPKSSRGEDWVDYKIDKGNIIMFGSGMGDGLYSRYVGFDKKKSPVKLITDFIRLSELE